MSRFQKGRSGNPKGRPRKEKPTAGSAFDIVIDRTLTITQDGRAREVTVDEGLQHATYLQAIAGSRPARREILRMIARREKALVARAPRPVGVTVMKEGPDPENANDALVLLGIAADEVRTADHHDPYRRMLLEPWAVEAALKRRGLRLSRKDLDEAKRCTRDRQSIDWPEATRE